MNIQPPPQAAPGPAPDPAPDLAACVGAIRTSIVDWSATNPLLGRALDPVTAQILVLLQLLADLLARLAAGDLPPAPQPRAPLAPTLPELAPPDSDHPESTHPESAHPKTGPRPLPAPRATAPRPVPHPLPLGTTPDQRDRSRPTAPIIIAPIIAPNLRPPHRAPIRAGPPQKSNPTTPHHRSPILLRYRNFNPTSSFRPPPRLNSPP